MCDALLRDATLYEQFFAFDHDLAAAARAAGCGFRGGRLHSAPLSVEALGRARGPGARVHHAVELLLRRWRVPTANDTAVGAVPGSARVSGRGRPLNHGAERGHHGHPGGVVCGRGWG